MQAHRRITDRYPLRVTIVVVLLLLVTVALLASGFTATTIMRGYLINKVDDQLVEASKTLPRPRPFGEAGCPGDPGAGGQGRRPPLPSNIVLQFNLADGTPQIGPCRATLPNSTPEPLPNLPTLDLNQVRKLDGEPFNTKAVSGGVTWRVLNVPLPDGGGSVVVAQSLAEMDQTLTQLVGIQAAAGIILLVLLAGVGTYVVRRSLRGLEDVEHTAVAIAGGDLSRRVPQRDPRTEVGRLSLALNQMLGQIEGAFAQRTASEFAARRSEDASKRSEENARQSEERMRRFIADASHELRTPLTSIRGFAELTRQTGAAADPATMKRIEDEAKRMGLLVDDLLLLARLDQQRPLQHQPVDLLTLAGDSVHDVQAVQPGREMKLQILPDSGAPVVSGDEARLRQVLGNLVSNALHHTPVDAPITISVGTRAGEAIVEVADTGPGLSGEQKVKVFERFYRADSARTRSTGGSGLGLSIVAALVAAHGGKVTVTDTTPHGATFTVHLPVAL